VRPGGSLLALKVLPLVLPLAGLLKRRMYTYRWVSLLVWLYFTEGVVRAWSDMQAAGRILAGIEILLCLLLFVACAWHVRTRLAHADAMRQAQRNAAAAAWSDLQAAGRILAGIEILLCLLLFVACAWHVRTRLAHADAMRQAQRNAAAATS